MDRATAERCVQLLEASPEVGVVDITGGAPELNPQFRFLVESARALGREVLDRCNLTVLLEPGQEDLVQFLADNQVRRPAPPPAHHPSSWPPAPPCSRRGLYEADGGEHGSTAGDKRLIPWGEGAELQKFFSGMGLTTLG